MLLNKNITMVNEEVKEWVNVVKALNPVNNAIIAIYTSVAKNINDFSAHYHANTKDFIKEVSNNYSENANQAEKSFIFFKHVIDNLQLYGVVNSDGGLRQQHGNTQAHEKEHAMDEGNQSHMVFATGTTSSANIKDDTLTGTNISAGTNSDLNAMEFEISDGKPPPSPFLQQQYDDCNDNLLECKYEHLECKESKSIIEQEHTNCTLKNIEQKTHINNANKTIKQYKTTLLENQSMIDQLDKDNSTTTQHTCTPPMPTQHTHTPPTPHTTHTHTSHVHAVSSGHVRVLWHSL